jgi:acetyl esterase/lipase
VDKVEIQEQCNALFDILWNLPAEKYQEAWKSTPLVMPGGTPMDLYVTIQTIPLRDSYEAELKVYKDTEKLKTMGEKGQNAPLMLVAYGGEWMMGDHDVKEDVCRWIAKLTGVVVIDVDYKL